MRILDQNNNILTGILIGATVPVIGYIIVEAIFELMTQQGLMDEVSASTAAKRKQTLSLIALCFNIISVQFFKKRKYTSIINGIVTATMIYAIFWVLLFKVF